MAVSDPAEGVGAAVAPRMGPAEFVAFVALSLVAGAVAVDMMLPALLPLGEDLGLADSNRGQAVIAVFVLGVGASQLLFGPLSDRYGRRPLFIAGVLLLVAGSAAGALAQDFQALLVARLLQGIGAGAQRVVTFSVVRDLHAGPRMTRVMSLAMAVVLLEPIVAPLLGQLILLFASWRWIVAAVAVVGGISLGWALWRLEESLPVARRRSLSPRSLVAAYRTVVRTRVAFVCMIVCGLVMGAHLGFLSSAQAIFQRTFDAGLHFTPLLALVSLAMSAAAFANARLVRRFGSAELIRAALYVLVTVSTVALALAVAGRITLPVFLAVQACNMFVFGMLLPNLTAMSMNPLGSIAGTASSMFGFVSMTVGALLGGLVGQFFDGTLRPVLGAYVILGVTALLVLRHLGREEEAPIVQSTKNELTVSDC